MRSRKSFHSPAALLVALALAGAALGSPRLARAGMFTTEITWRQVVCAYDGFMELDLVLHPDGKPWKSQFIRAFGAGMDRPRRPYLWHGPISLWRVSVSGHRATRDPLLERAIADNGNKVRMLVPYLIDAKDGDIRPSWVTVSSVTSAWYRWNETYAIFALRILGLLIEKMIWQDLGAKPPWCHEPAAYGHADHTMGEQQMQPWFHGLRHYYLRSYRP